MGFHRDTQASILAALVAQQFTARTPLYYNHGYGTVDVVVYNVQGNGFVLNYPGEPTVGFEARRAGDEHSKVFSRLTDALTYINVPELAAS